MSEPQYDREKIENTLLALLYASSFDDGRFWKGYDFGLMDSLHEKGYITEPYGKAKSAYLTAEGMQKAQKLADAMFGVD